MEALDHLNQTDTYRFETLCRDAHKALVLMSPEDFEAFAATPFGGAVMFIVNQWIKETEYVCFDDPYFYAGKFITDSE